MRASAVEGRKSAASLCRSLPSCRSEWLSVRLCSSSTTSTRWFISDGLSMKTVSVQLRLRHVRINKRKQKSNECRRAASASSRRHVLRCVCVHVRMSSVLIVFIGACDYFVGSV